MWEQLRTSRVNVDFSSKKRDREPKQMSLSKFANLGRNDSGFSKLDSSLISEQNC